MKRTAVILLGAAALIAAIWFLRRALDAGEPLARAGDVRTGSWWFPRGGPHILGFTSPGTARLFIDGVVVAEGKGRVVQRVVYPAGAHAVRFEAPDEARLLWHPPGRRGSPEYVPASSLSPEADARFGAGAGASWGDAAAATAILGVLALAFVLLARIGRPGRDVWLVFAVALALRLALVAHGDQTWDEDEYWSAGRNYLVNLLHGDLSWESWLWNSEHPPVTKYFAGLGALWWDGFAAAKAIFALLGAAACAFTGGIARRLFPGVPRAALCAGLVAAFLPHLVAHSAIVGHETVSVFFWTLAVWLALRVHDGPAPGLAALAGRISLVAIVVGLAVGARYLNVLLVPLVGLALLVGAPREAWLRTALVGAVVLPLVGFAVLVGVSPLMHADPWHTWEAGQRIARNSPIVEWFLGERIRRAPSTYFAVYLVVTTPIAVLVAAAAGIVVAVRRRAWGALLVVAWLGAALAVGYSPIRRDGVRYALPALPALALGAGYVLARIAERRRGWTVPAAIAVYLGVNLAWAWPYPLDYYNEVVGGAGRAQERRWFEVGWWGEGIAAAVAHVNAHAEKDAAVSRLVTPNHTTWFRVDLWARLADRPVPGGWAVLNDAWGDLTGGRPPNTHLVHEVRAQGASLVRVYRPGEAP